MAINWQEHSVVDYVEANNLQKELKYILRNEGYMDEDSTNNGPFAGFDFECVDEFGGEGQGERAWYVYEITYPDEHKEYWRADLMYYSYDGVQWDYWNIDSFYKVEKKQVIREEWVEK